ncbi:unnamed protein product [Urochloa humidicola]
MELLLYVLQGKENMCDFVEWKDDKWPPMFQKVASSIWEIVGKFKRQEKEAQLDLLAIVQNRNDVHEEKEALLEEKMAWTREKETLIKDKKMLYCVILALLGVLMAVLLGVVFKNK